MTKSAELTVSPRVSCEAWTLTGRERDEDAWNGDIGVQADPTDTLGLESRSEAGSPGKELALWCQRALALLTEHPGKISPGQVP